MVSNVIYNILAHMLAFNLCCIIIVFNLRTVSCVFWRQHILGCLPMRYY